VTTAANLALSFVLAVTWGIQGVAVSTLLTDVLALAYILPRYAAPAAGTTSGALVRAIARPLVPAVVVGGAILVALGRAWHPETLLALVPLGALWTLVAVAAVWRYGLAPDERERFGREFRRGGGAQPMAADL
jgi:hypothetical protein